MNEPIDDHVDRERVAVVEAAAERVGQHLLGEAAVEIHAALGGQNALEPAHIREVFTRDELPGGIDPLLHFLLAPAAHRVEIFKCEAERVHALVARAAQRVAAVEREHLAELGLAILELLLRLLEVGDVRRRRRGAEDIFEHE